MKIIKQNFYLNVQTSKIYFEFNPIITSIQFIQLQNCKPQLNLNLFSNNIFEYLTSKFQIDTPNTFQVLL